SIRHRRGREARVGDARDHGYFRIKWLRFAFDISRAWPRAIAAAEDRQNLMGAHHAELPLAATPVLSPRFFCAIELTGQPIGKGRPRFTRTKSGRPLVYTPAETRSYERDLAWAAKLAMGTREPTTQPTAITVEAGTWKSPADWSRAKREAALAGTLLPTGKPDADNLL